MNQQINYQEAMVRELSQLLMEERKLKVLDQDHNQGNFNLRFMHCIHVLDSESKKEYSLLVCDNRNYNDLHCAKIQCKYLKTLQHPNLIQYYDSFTIGQYYVIQIERIQTSLFDWINDKDDNNPITELNYVEIAIQMLDVTYYLNNNKSSIHLESTLSSFVINQEQRIKLIHFVTPQAINISRAKESFSKCRDNNELFYYRMNILKMSNKCKIWQVFDLDLWAIGICLYYLSGASTQHILSYLTDEEPYQFSQHLGFENNAILYSIICDTKRFQNLISFSCLIQSFEQQKQRILQKEQLFKQDTENYQNQQNRIKEDFLMFSKIHKQIYNDKVENYQYEEIQKLIVKYAEFDQLQSLLTKYHISTNNWADAFAISNKMIQTNPQSDISYFNLGFISEQIGNFVDSIGYFEKSLAINPLQDSSNINIGNSYSELKSKDSTKYYRKALETNYNNRSPYYNIGIDYDKNLDHKNAIQSFKKVLKLNRKDSFTIYNLVDNYNKKSEFEKAIHSQRKFIQIEEEAENDGFGATILLKHFYKQI